MKKRELQEIQRENRKSFFWIQKKGFSIYLSENNKSEEISAIIKTILQEYLEITTEEERMIQFLDTHYEEMDEEEVSIFLKDLACLKKETLTYYDSLLDHIQQGGTKIDKRDFKILTERDDFKIRLKGLLLTMEDIVSYLGYPADFWNYIASRISIRDSHIEEHKFFYLVNVKCDSQNHIVDMHVGVPAIINLETALVNIHEFKHAYDLYRRIGEVFEEEEQYEEDAREEEKVFVKEYIHPLVNLES